MLDLKNKIDETLLDLKIDKFNIKWQPYDTMKLGTLGFAAFLFGEDQGQHKQEVLTFLNDIAPLIKNLSSKGNKETKEKIYKLLNAKPTRSGFIYSGKTPIQIAIKAGGNITLIKKLIDLGADINLPSDTNEIPIEMAIAFYNETLTSILFEKTDPNYLQTLCQNYQNKDYSLFKKYSHLNDIDTDTAMPSVLNMILKKVCYYRNKNNNNNN